MLMRAVRSRSGGVLVRWMISQMPFLIPSERRRETAALVAFHHPRPAYPVHILIVARSGTRSLADLPDDSFFSDLRETVAALVSQFDLEAPGYRLILNGGGYQEVDLLHVHLVSGEVSPGQG